MYIIINSSSHKYLFASVTILNRYCLLCYLYFSFVEYSSVAAAAGNNNNNMELNDFSLHKHNNFICLCGSRRSNYCFTESD